MPFFLSLHGFEIFTNPSSSCCALNRHLLQGRWSLHLGNLSLFSSLDPGHSGIQGVVWSRVRLLMTLQQRRQVGGAGAVEWSGRSNYTEEKGVTGENVYTVNKEKTKKITTIKTRNT